MKIKHVNYSKQFRENCLALFDENCPTYFAENERDDYEAFLDTPIASIDYELGLVDDRVIAAFGLIADESSKRARLAWIMVSGKYFGQGLGSKLMQRAFVRAHDRQCSAIDIAASHLSAPFFVKHGAKELRKVQDGWGEGMHRIDMELPLK